LVFHAVNDENALKVVPRLLDDRKIVIDISGTYRIPKRDFEKYYGITHTAPWLLKMAVYGLPASEEQRDKIRGAKLIANPGCYAGAFILAMRPLGDYVAGPASINATSGRTGARKEPTEDSNQITYKWGPNHQHIPEMWRYSGVKVRGFWAMVSNSVRKGINMNIEVLLNRRLRGDNEEKAEDLRNLIRKYYRSDDLVKVVYDSDEHKYGDGDANDTHLTLVKVNGVFQNIAYLTVMTDNLGPGAASRGVENMNLKFGFNRHEGIDMTYKTLTFNTINLKT